MKPTLGCRRLFACDRVWIVVLAMELAVALGLTSARADPPRRTLSPQEIKRLEGNAQAHVEAYLARDYQTALGYAEQWLRVQPDNMIPRRDVAHAKARILFGRGEAAEARGDMTAAAEAYAEAVKIYPRDSMEQDDFRSIALAALRRTLAGSPVASATLLGVGDTSRQPPHFNRAACLENSSGGTSQSNRAAPLSSMQVPSTGSAVAAPTASTGSGLTFATGNLSSPPVQKDWSGVGVYELEGAIDFNVLDWVFFDPATQQLVLVGRRDPRFAGRRIPYLNHLAAMLDHPRAEMTLAWAPDSERRVDAFLRRMDSSAELAKLAREAGTIWDGKGGITESAKWLLPYMGMQPGPDGMYGYMERDDVNAALLATAGNVEGACVVLAARALKFFEKAQRDTRQFYFWEVIRSLGLKSELEGLVAQQRAGQMTEERYTYLTMRRVCERLDQIFGLDGSPVLRAFDNQMRVSRNNTLGMDTCFGEFDKHRRAIAERAMDKVFGRVREVSIAIDGISSLMGTRPEVTPKFTNVDATSSLAQLMFEADYLGKQLINLPEHEAQDIAGYRTEFAFNRENPTKRVGKNATQHLWFSVDGVDAARTRDGNGLEVRGARVRINTREYDAQGRDKPAIIGGYGDLLTSFYPQFAERFQVLHELQEAAKLTAVAQWIKQRRPDFALPQEGRRRWTPPTRVPGVMYMTVALVESKTSANTVLSAVGGVSLRESAANWQRTLSDKAVNDRMFDGAGGSLPGWRFTKTHPNGWTGRGMIDNREVSAVAVGGTSRPQQQISASNVMNPPPLNIDEEKASLKDAVGSPPDIFTAALEACQVASPFDLFGFCKGSVSTLSERHRQLRRRIERCTALSPNALNDLKQEIARYNTDFGNACMAQPQTHTECRKFYIANIRSGLSDLSGLWKYVQDQEQSYRNCLISLPPQERVESDATKNHCNYDRMFSVCKASFDRVYKEDKAKAPQSFQFCYQEVVKGAEQEYAQGPQRCFNHQEGPLDQRQ